MHQTPLLPNDTWLEQTIVVSVLQSMNEKYENVIFTDKCMVQLEWHSRLCFRRTHQCRRLKPRPKHSIKLHIWGGISSWGATNIVMFRGIMDVQRYKQILEVGLLPFINECSADSHRLQQDNEPKHCSNLIDDCFTEKRISWWWTPPESPDLNPIENVWGSEYPGGEHLPSHQTWTPSKMYGVH